MVVVELNTTEFGPVTGRPEDIFEFPEGLPGFEEHTRFLHYRPPSLSPIEVLLSLTRPNLRFYALPLPWVSPGYTLNLTEEQRTQLALGPTDSPSDCLALLTWPETGEPTVNLLAPVVLHRPSGRGLQAIQFDSNHPTQHPLRPGAGPC